MTQFTPQCFRCKHFKSFSGNDEGLIYNCDAFPDGIPNDIVFNKFDHTKKHPKQDNEIVFEPIEEKE